MRFTTVPPPKIVKVPAAYIFPLESAASAFTVPSPKPSPTADQLVPFHIAILLAVEPPAAVKDPPAYRFELEPQARALAPALRPGPSADQLVPFHLAM
jgi:hypothetical protein